MPWQAVGGLESKEAALARGKDLREAAYDVLVLAALRWGGPSSVCARAQEESRLGGAGAGCCKVLGGAAFGLLVPPVLGWAAASGPRTQRRARAGTHARTLRTGCAHATPAAATP